MEKYLIDQLLEKYWEAETSLEEERTLKQYFNSDQVAESHEPFKAMFSFFKEEKEIGISLEKAMAKVEQEPAVNKPQARIISLRKWGMSIAASLVMIFSAIGVWNYYTQEIEISYTDAEVEEAYAVTMKALAFLSGKMNESTGSVKENMDKITSKDIFK